MRDKIWFMAIVLGMVSGVAGLALAAVQSVTAPVIEQRILEQKIKPSLDQFFGPLNPENDFIADRVTLDLGRDDMGRMQRLTMFKAKKGGKVIGAALKTAASGYGGDVEVLSAFNLVTNTLIGVKTLSQKETKGLGARVGDDSEPFIQQFRGLAYQSGVKLKANGGEVDAISGATITSTAFTSAVDKAVNLLNQYRKEVTQ